MTVQNHSVTGASPTYDYLWRQINWRHAEAEVRRLQMRIAKAVKMLGYENSFKKA